MRTLPHAAPARPALAGLGLGHLPPRRGRPRVRARSRPPPLSPPRTRVCLDVPPRCPCSARRPWAGSARPGAGRAPPVLVTIPAAAPGSSGRLRPALSRSPPSSTCAAVTAGGPRGGPGRFGRRRPRPVCPGRAGWPSSRRRRLPSRRGRGPALAGRPAGRRRARASARALRPRRAVRRVRARVRALSGSALFALSGRRGGGAGSAVVFSTHPPPPPVLPRLPGRGAGAKTARWATSRRASAPGWPRSRSGCAAASRSALSLVIIRLQEVLVYLVRTRSRSPRCRRRAR